MIEALKNGLPPIVDENSTHLILGTLPGDDSLKSQRYYAHGKNQLWAILATIYGEAIPVDYECRKAFLRRHGVALWDVLHSAEREGSSDRKIKNPGPNDFVELFARYSRLRVIGFNGTTAEKFFKDYVRSLPGIPTAQLRCIGLPSTSPTPGKHVKSLEQKISCWRDFLSASPSGPSLNRSQPFAPRFQAGRPRQA